MCWQKCSLYPRRIHVPENVSPGGRNGAKQSVSQSVHQLNRGGRKGSAVFSPCCCLVWKSKKLKGGEKIRREKGEGEGEVLLTLTWLLLAHSSSSNHLVSSRVFTLVRPQVTVHSLYGS